MRHAVFVEPGRVEWREAADPRVQGPGEAVVRPLVVGRCDLDVAYVRGVLPLASGEPIGHEIIGEVVELADDVRRLRLGDRVFVPAQISCGACRLCLSGSTGRCAQVPFAASYGMGRPGAFGGGLADLVRVPYAQAMLTPVPAGVEVASLIGAADMASDAWRGVGPPLQRRPGARVLVIGGMPPVIGLYAVGLARALGASAVDYVDPDPQRCAVAIGYGAHRLTALAEAPADTYDVVFVANPEAASLEHAFRAVAPGGSITSATPALDGSPSLATAGLYHKGVNWTIGRPDCRHAHDGVMQAWSACGFNPDHIPTQRVAWEDAPEAWSSDALYVAAVRA